MFLLVLREQCEVFSCDMIFSTQYGVVLVILSIYNGEDFFKVRFDNARDGWIWRKKIRYEHMTEGR